MSVICQNFVQNAWKKELCSNCFKSKDEHVQKLRQKLNPLPKSFTISSIIKNNKSSKHKNKVLFKEKLVEVIGIGGEDWSEDEADVEIYEESSASEEADAQDDDEFKAIEKLTKINTDYNTNIPKDVADTKKSYSQLLLGKPQVDSDGRKHTLKVNVVPFGEEKEKKNKPLIQLPITKNKGTSDDNKGVVLKSYSKTDNSNEEKSLLDEINETLEKSKNSIQIISRKKPMTTNGENKENVLAEKTEIKDPKNDTKTTAIERKNCLTRNPGIKRDEKPLIVHTAVAKIELKNNKEQKVERNESKPSLIINQQQDETKNSTLQTNVKVLPSSSSSSEVDSIETSSRSSEDDSSKEDSDSSLDKLSSNFVQSRELAGEPDGRADPEDNEPPALPLTPPPALELQISPEKPKIPNKPATILIKKPINTNLLSETPHVLTTFAVEPEKTKLTKQDSNGSDVCKATNKRRAPNPPNEEIVPLYTRHSVITPNTDSPVVREKEKRERASSCSPKVRNFISNNPQGSIDFSPEPAPRKSLSVSTDSLSNCVDEKKKMKGRFSLKKFLRMGTNKDFPKIPLELTRSEEEVPPQIKPRLVIVHPIDLNNSKVEVVNKPEALDLRAPKPPPPPRNYDESRTRIPHPPKPSEIKNKMTTNIKKDERVYANIGEVRSSLTPNKPQRTASMREREAQNNGYEPVIIKACKRTANSYDCASSGSSSPEYETCKVETCKEQPVDNSGEYYKYSIPRSTSLTYCGSETESEIYSPYSYYGSESEVAEDDDWTGSTGRTHKLRSKKGRSIVHKNLEDNYGAVVVANHEALAQVLENIQHNPATPLAYRGLKCAPNLRWSDFSIKTQETSVKVGSRVFYQATWGAQNVTLLISAGSVPTSPLSLGTLSLAPITEFSDLLPIKFLPSSSTPQDVNYLQATVAVLPSLQVNTIQSYGEILKNKAATNNEDVSKDANLLLLQLVNALKTLQAQGIEELPMSLTTFVLCKDIDKESFYNRLYVLQGLGENITQKDQEEPVGSLCSCALTALQILQPTGKLTTLLTSLLNTERAVSLTQVKSVLEFSLWGPSDVALGSKIRERELALQRWLDLQRATVLHGLVCAKVQLTIYEECHLIFLVRSNAKMMCEASLLLEANRKV